MRFYAVELQTEESDPAALQALAEVGAGRVVSAEDPAALAAVYDQVASELVNQLVVTYPSAAGGATELAITITHQGASASATATVTLPGTASPTTSTSATHRRHPPRPRRGDTGRYHHGASPPPRTCVGGPGPLGAPWVLPAGLARGVPGRSGRDRPGGDVRRPSHPPRRPKLAGSASLPQAGC